MIEVYGDLWSYEPCDAICVTTNGHVNEDGNAAMSAGCALEAQTHFPGCAKTLGDLINKEGNNVHLLADRDGMMLFSFPVKHHYRDRADLELIARSCNQLMAVADVLELNNVLLPRPGCGYGHRTWEEVKPLIEPLLDDRIKVITWAE